MGNQEANDCQTSSLYIVRADVDGNVDETTLVDTVKTYLWDRLMEIRARLSNGSRSVFDFTDMAVLIGALANVTDAHSKHDTEQYIDFVKSEFVPTSELRKDLVATVFYCLLRCGLVHEMSLGGHNISVNRRNAINDYEVSVSHDKSPNAKWYEVNQGTKHVVFYAHELLDKIASCIEKCFDGKSDLWRTVRGKVMSDSGIRVIGVEAS